MIFFTWHCNALHILARRSKSQHSNLMNFSAMLGDALRRESQHSTLRFLLAQRVKAVPSVVTQITAQIL